MIIIFAIMVLLIVVPIVTLLGISYKTIWNNDLNYLWPNALEMGYYKQGTGKLRSLDDKYCCLGVLCNILAQQNLVQWRFPVDNEHSAIGWYVKTEQDTSFTCIPIDLRLMLNLEHQNNLIEMNDGMPGQKVYSFKEIAQYIRKNIKLKNF